MHAQHTCTGDVLVAASPRTGCGAEFGVYVCVIREHVHARVCAHTHAHTRPRTHTHTHMHIRTQHVRAHAHWLTHIHAHVTRTRTVVGVGERATTERRRADTPVRVGMPH